MSSFLRMGHMTRSTALVRRTELRSTKPMARGPWRSKPREHSEKPARPTPIKSRGMKGVPATAAQKLFWGRLIVDVGCIACRLDGRENHECSIHHTDGRTKPHAHWLVLPLCAGHHQDGTGSPGLIAVHPYKARFEARYGAQRHLLAQCLDILYQTMSLVVPEAEAAIAVAGTAGEVSP